MCAKIYPESNSSKEHFICLIRTEVENFCYYRVIYAKLFSDVIKHNNPTSIVVSYCEGVLQSTVKQFNKMNMRFASQHKNYFSVSYDFFMSYMNYLTKYKSIHKEQIWINPRYKINEYNAELFCGMDFDIDPRENDNVSVTTHTVDDTEYDSDN